MPIDFTSFLLPYQPSYQAPSGGGASSFNQILANRAAAQQQQRELAAGKEQLQIEEAGRTERDKLKIGAESEQKLKDKRADFVKRFAEASKQGDSTTLMAMTPEAEALGWRVKRVQGGEGRPDPTDPFGKLNPLSVPAYDVVRIEDAEGVGQGSADVGETLAGNRKKIQQVGEARVALARPQDVDAEIQQTAGLYGLGAPVDAGTYEDAAGRNNREERERTAAAGRAVSAYNAAESRNLTLGIHESNKGLRERALALQEERDKANAKRKETSDYKAAATLAEQIGAKAEIPKMASSLRDAQQAIELLKPSTSDVSASRAQAAVLGKLTKFSAGPGSISDFERRSIQEAQGLLEKYEYKLRSGLANEITGPELAEYQLALDRMYTLMNKSFQRQMEGYERRIPRGAGRAVVREAMGDYMDQYFGDQPWYENNHDVAIDPAAGGEDLDAVLNEVDSAGP